MFQVTRNHVVRIPVSQSERDVPTQLFAIRKNLTAGPIYGAEYPAIAG